MRFILALLLLISLDSAGQWKSFIISVKGDTLNRVDMQGKKQGPWVISMPELRGEPGYEEQGYFIDDKKDGLWVRFSLMGDKIAEENYRWGVLDGKSRYYTRNGGLLREESWRAVDPKKTMDTVDVVDLRDPSKVIDRVIVKVEGQTYRHGTWTYYEPMWGRVETTEKYFLNKLQTGDEFSMGDDDDIRPLGVSAGRSKTDSLGNKTVTKPQAVLDYEKKNQKKKIKSRDGQTGL